MNIETFFNTVKNFPPSQSILMRGSTGIGKSQIAKRLAEYHNLPLVDVRGSTMSEGDTGGYPDIEAMKENGVMTFVMPSWFVRACREPVVLLLDELNRSLRSVQQSFFQIVLDRELGNDKDGNPYKLNPGTRVIAAVNHGSEYDVNDMDPALLRRFWVADIETSVDSWINWASDNDIHEIIIDFIRHEHDHFQVDLTKVSPGSVVPTPASWHKLSYALSHMNIDLNDYAGLKRKSNKVYNITSGFVGNESSIVFTSFLKNYNRQITPDNILNEWDAFKSKVLELSSDKINGLIQKIVDDMKINEWEVHQAENVSKFAQVITEEMTLHFWSEITKTKRIENIRKIHKYLGSYIVEIVNKAQLNSKK